MEFSSIPTQKQIKNILSKNIIPDIAEIISKYVESEKLFIIYDKRFNEEDGYDVYKRFIFQGIYKTFKDALFSLLKILGTKSFTYYESKEFNEYKDNKWKLTSSNYFNSLTFEEWLDDEEENIKIDMEIYEVPLEKLPYIDSGIHNYCFRLDLADDDYVVNDNYKYFVDNYVPLKEFLKEFKESFKPDK